MAKMKVVFLRKHNDVLCIVGTKSIKQTVDMVDFKGKKYILDLLHPTYVIEKTAVYCVNLDSGMQYVFHGETQAYVNPEDLDIIVGQKIIRELTQGVVNNKKEIILTVILGAVVGALVMGLVLVLYYTGRIEEILKEGIVLPYT